MRRGKQAGLTLGGEAVFLEATSGLLRDGEFDEPGLFGGVKVVSAEIRTVGELETLHTIEGAEGGFVEAVKEVYDLVGHLVADLVGSGGVPECREECAEQEFDKGGGVSGIVAGGEDFVVFLLLVTDHGFHREEGEERVPVAEDERLPQSTHAAITIGEGVDEFEFVVEDATGDQRMGVGAFEPVEQVHGSRSVVRARACRRGRR